MKVIVIGNGEVGSALIKLLSENNNVDYTDLNHKAKGTFDIMCVAIPYSESFIDTIKNYQEEYQPKATIIFSSVAVGTSKQLNAVHSPVEGIHPKLYESLKTFTRFIGGRDELAERFIKENFKVDIVKLPLPEHTEFLKLRSTTLYGINIEFARYSNEVAKLIDMLYELVNIYDVAYNDFYRQMGKTQYSRYVLYPPEGKIGGHCVRENCKILKEQYPNKILDIIE